MLLIWFICATVFSYFTAFANSSQNISYSQLIPCGPESYFLGEKCYKLISEGKGLVFAEASNSCKANQGSLVTIDTKEIQDFLTAFIILQEKINVWIGLHDRGEESVYKWDDGSVVNYTNWGPGEPTGTNNEKEDCVELLYKHIDKISVWNDVPCSYALPFICQSKKNETISSHDSRFCPINRGGGGGLKYLTSCYHIVHEEKSWDDAEKYCQDNFKGHLLKILGPKAEMFLEYVLADYSKEFWIGIKNGTSKQLMWSSGWHVAYNNWSDKQYDFVINTDTCAMKSAKNPWTIVQCFQTRPFICETSTEHPAVLEKGPKAGRCPANSTDWLDLGGNKCYTFQNDSLKWDDANSFCMAKGGTLVIIESPSETNALRPYVDEIYFWRLYIGLHRSSMNEDVFEWIDGTPYIYKNWRPNEPNNKNEKCVDLFTDNMKWNDNSCDVPSPFICSAMKTFPDAEQRISDSKLIPCQRGSYYFGEKCYRPFTVTKAGLTWWHASEFCRETAHGNLVTIDSKEIQDFLTAFIVLQTRLNFWIGLHDIAEESVYTWEDGSVANYTNWGPGEPTHSENEYCVELRYKHHDEISVWNDVPCTWLLHFICQSNKSETFKTYDSRFCPIEQGGGWKYLDSCYHIVNEEKPWDEAEKYCQDNFEGHLSYILGPKEEMFLDYVLADYSKEFWIGIKNGTSSQLKWTAGWHVVYSNWNDGQKDFINGTCALKSSNNSWTTAQCFQTRPFVCETSTDKPVILENDSEGGKCPDKSNDWLDLGGNKCYTFQNEYLKWDDANSFCMAKGGTLVIIESEEETSALRPYVAEQYNRLYIGLHRSSRNEDVFEWVDGTPNVYNNWRPNEPNNRNEKCVDLFDNMKWNDNSCDVPTQFICSAKKSKSCTDTDYGCCSDGKTAAIGPKEAGCPKTDNCADTAYGCCPDGKTTATGYEQAGCPLIIDSCTDMIHGCCPDGKTAATGPDQAGCPTIGVKNCTDMAYGCCPDGKTAAEGPDKAGCPIFLIVDESCSETVYGCCPDGKNAAEGPDHAGCPLNKRNYLSYNILIGVAVFTILLIALLGIAIYFRCRKINRRKDSSVLFINEYPSKNAGARDNPNVDLNLEDEHAQ